MTARAFVVDIAQNGTAQPLDLLVDLDGNGRCDSEDAELAGYKVLSGEEVMKIQQIYGLLPTLPKDLDDNGSFGSRVAPAGPGRITQPPR